MHVTSIMYITKLNYAVIILQYTTLQIKNICYWYNEMNTNRPASTYDSFLVDYLEQELRKGNNWPIIIYSNGSPAQTRNAILSNELLHLSEKFE